MASIFASECRVRAWKIARALYSRYHRYILNNFFSFWGRAVYVYRYGIYEGLLTLKLSKTVRLTGALGHLKCILNMNVHDLFKIVAFSMVMFKDEFYYQNI